MNHVPSLPATGRFSLKPLVGARCLRVKVMGRTASLALLFVSEVAAMSVWFATTASVAAIRRHWTLTPFHEALLTSSVQAGFVAGTCVSAVLSLADRFDLRRLFSASAAIAGIANLLIALCEPTSPAVPLLRFVTGVALMGFRGGGVGTPARR